MSRDFTVKHGNRIIRGTEDKNEIRLFGELSGGITPDEVDSKIEHSQQETKDYVDSKTDDIQEELDKYVPYYEKMVSYYGHAPEKWVRVAEFAAGYTYDISLTHSNGYYGVSSMTSGNITLISAVSTPFGHKSIFSSAVTDVVEFNERFRFDVDSTNDKIYLEFKGQYGTNGLDFRISRKNENASYNIYDEEVINYTTGKLVTIKLYWDNILDIPVDSVVLDRYSVNNYLSSDTGWFFTSSDGFVTSEDLVAKNSSILHATHPSNAITIYVKSDIENLSVVWGNGEVPKIDIVEKLMYGDIVTIYHNVDTNELSYILNTTGREALSIEYILKRTDERYYNKEYVNRVFQEKLIAGDGIRIDNNTISSHTDSIECLRVQGVDLNDCRVHGAYCTMPHRTYAVLCWGGLRVKNMPTGASSDAICWIYNGENDAQQHFTNYGDTTNTSSPTMGNAGRHWMRKRIHSTNSWSDWYEIENGETYTAGYGIEIEDDIINGEVEYIEQEAEWKAQTWSGYTSFYGRHIWKDYNGVIHYDYNTNHYYLNSDGVTWLEQTWSGNALNYGGEIWTDNNGVIHFDSSWTHYYLDSDGITWKLQTWKGYTSSIFGNYIWKDYNGVIHYDNGSTHYYLDSDGVTWKEQTWNEYTSIIGKYIWRDYNGLIHYDNNSLHYYLDSDGVTWKEQTWNEYTGNINGEYIWIDNNGVIHYDNAGNHYYLDSNSVTWNQEIWSGYTGGMYGFNIWKDYNGVIHYDEGSNHYYLLDEKKQYLTRHNDELQIKLLAGTGITISNNVIRATTTGGVSSVAGKTGAVTLTKDDVGLENVGNFKAVSTEASQGLTETEQLNARDNIGAAAGDHTHSEYQPLLSAGDGVKISNNVIRQDNLSATRFYGSNTGTIASTWVKVATYTSANLSSSANLVCDCFIPASVKSARIALKVGSGGSSITLSTPTVKLVYGDTSVENDFRVYYSGTKAELWVNYEQVYRFWAIKEVFNCDRIGSRSMWVFEDSKDITTVETLPSWSYVQAARI